MTLGQLGLAYLVVGAVLAAAFVARGDVRRDAWLVVTLWPVWVPLVLAQSRAAPVERDLRLRLAHVTRRLEELDRQRAAYHEELVSLRALVTDVPAPEVR